MSPIPGASVIYRCWAENSPNPFLVEGEQTMTFANDHGFSYCEQKGLVEPIRIGIFSGLTGATKMIDEPYVNGVRFAFDEVNAKGGLQGRPLKLYVEDDQGKSEEAALVVEKLLKRDKVVALISGEGSSPTLAVVPLVERAGIPMVVGGATNPRVTVGADGKVFKNIFRTAFIDPFQGKVMAAFARRTLHAQTAAIFKDNANDYSVGLADFFKASFVELGGKILVEGVYAHGDISFKAQLIGIASESPDVLFVPDGYGDIGLIARQAREVGIRSTFLGGDAWDMPALFEIGGRAVEGSYFSHHFSVEVGGERTQSFVAVYQSRFGEKSGVWSALGYDAAGVLIAAIQRAGSAEPALIRGALEMTRDYPGVTGDITIDGQHNADKPAVVLKVTGGKYQYVESVNP